MKRRILLVDDEVAVLLTLKAVLEISGFDVDTATSAREGKARIKHREYEMVITDMRMEGERAGEEVINAAKAASYKPAVALLSAFPVDEDALADMGADKVLVKPMHTRQLLQQLEALYVRHHGDESATDVDGSTTGAKAVKPAKKSARSAEAENKATPADDAASTSDVPELAASVPQKKRATKLAAETRTKATVRTTGKVPVRVASKAAASRAQKPATV